ncbi:hypothetical protein FUAX_24340 [Fulvitalea axinellae]|uniref:Uncharacterized protein n=1 Tax=Fulvitalea axinellae TaxID=1182444 RepID=A0AAU9CPX1_9BACT|nr:hypothetical protein FUAX_24340 [Fulvitalea axinellae]
MKRKQGLFYDFFKNTKSHFYFGNFTQQATARRFFNNNDIEFRHFFNGQIFLGKNPEKERFQFHQKGPF